MMTKVVLLLSLLVPTTQTRLPRPKPQTTTGESCRDHLSRLQTSLARTAHLLGKDKRAHQIEKDKEHRFQPLITAARDQCSDMYLHNLDVELSFEQYAVTGLVIE